MSTHRKKMMCSIVESTQKAIVTYLLAQQLHGLDQRKRANDALVQWKRRGANSSVLWAEICCESQQSYALARTGIPKAWTVVTDRGIAENSSFSKMTLSNKPCTNSKALLQIFCASRMLRIRNVFPHCHSLHVADSLKSLVAIQSQNFEIKDILSSNAMCWNQSNTWFETISPAINRNFQPSFWVLFVFCLVCFFWSNQAPLNLVWVWRSNQEFAWFGFWFDTYKNGLDQAHCHCTTL